MYTITQQEHREAQAWELLQQQMKEHLLKRAGINPLCASQPWLVFPPSTRDAIAAHAAHVHAQNNRLVGLFT